MKRKWLWALTSLLVIPVVFLSGCSCTRVELGDVPASLRVSLEGGQLTGIRVTGQGEVTAVPDIATLRLGIEAQEATVAEAQAEAAEAMDWVMSALKDNGVAEKDIQTQYFSIHKVTRWDPEENQEVILGYRVTNMVTAKIREVEEVGSIVDAVVEAGGDLTRVDDIAFSVDDPSVYQEEARQKAMADARAKAEHLARLGGVGLGKPIYISESIYMPSPVYPRVMVEEAVPGAAPPPTPISPGEMEISLTVQVAYAILD
jgi:hypothetical protein